MNKPTTIVETDRQIAVLSEIIANAVRERTELQIHRRKLEKIYGVETIVICDGEHVKLTITKG